jgi:ring-1,2-phenylacetyl-CoA epoxidase subunit PaaD
MGSVRIERSAREIVSDVPDPEMPWVTLGDLGIVRTVECGSDTSVRVELTPTYLGCPAIEAMRDDVTRALAGAGYRVESVGLRLDPPWTPASITEEGCRKLADAGIAPPPHAAPQPGAQSPPHVAPHQGAQSVALSLGVRCPHCGSIETTLLSRFGASPCQELRRCSACAEPFPAVRP